MKWFITFQLFSMLTLISLIICSKSQLNPRKLEETQKITLEVNEIGMQSILNESFRPLPDKILINGKELDEIDSKIKVTEKDSSIELIWNEPITDCHGMFADASNISKINFSDFETSKVTDMSSMFMNCESLENLDLSNFDTSNVLDMSKMFNKCANLKTLQINNFKTGKVTNMKKMFEYCISLEDLEIDNFDTSSVINMDYMFHSCSNLKNLDLSKFNTLNVKSILGMFAGCHSLNTLNLSHFNFTKTNNISYMLYQSDLMRLDLSNFVGSSINFDDETLKYNPDLKYINLQNYNGKDLFNDLEDNNEIIICTDNDNSNIASLTNKNAINNCSDFCFNEYIKIKEDKSGCEIDCSLIEDETNMYYYLCNLSKESTILVDSSTNEEKIDNTTTNEETNSASTTINNQTSADTTSSESSKLNILLYGYDNYVFQNNIMTFSIYFMRTGGNTFPSIIFFTINIIFDYITRNLVEQENKNITCSLEEENKLAKYNCELSPEEQINIQKVSINYDFNFNSPYELSVSPLAEYNKDKIMNQTSNLISSKDLIILYGNLISENNYFLIKGELDENKEIDDEFNLTVYSNTSNLINISCETTNEVYNNFEIRCAKDKSTSININNSMSYMDSKLLLVIINEGDSGNVDPIDIYAHKYSFRRNGNSLSAGAIIAIIAAIVLVCVITGLLLIFRKKLFKVEKQPQYSLGNYDTNNNLKDFDFK